VSDEKNAYIGSANLTEFGLAHNLEIGILSQGMHIQQLQYIVQAIAQSSTEIRDISFWESQDHL